MASSVLVGPYGDLEQARQDEARVTADAWLRRRASHNPVSQLFDSLRRGRQSQAPRRRRARPRGTPCSRRSATRRSAAGAIAIGARADRCFSPACLALGWAGWQFDRGRTRRPHRVRPPSDGDAATRRASVAPAPRRSLRRRRGQPSPELPAPDCGDPRADGCVAARSPSSRQSPSSTRRPAPPSPPAAPRAGCRAAAASARAATDGRRRGLAAPASSANDLELALYYHRAGDFENALQHYRALLQRNELNAQAHNNLGLLYQEKKLLAESARELQRASSSTAQRPRAQQLGVTLLLQGGADEAAAQFRSVLDARSAQRRCAREPGAGPAGRPASPRWRRRRC